MKSTQLEIKISIESVNNQSDRFRYSVVKRYSIRSAGYKGVSLGVLRGEVNVDS